MHQITLHYKTTNKTVYCGLSKKVERFSAANSKDNQDYDTIRGGILTYAQKLT